MRWWSGLSVAALGLSCNAVLDIREGTLRPVIEGACAAPPAATGALTWAETSQSQDTQAIGVAAGAGHVVVAGTYQGELEIDGTTASQTDMGFDMFVASFAAADGAVEWVNTYAGTGESIPFDVAVDRRNGDSYMVGRFDGSVTVEDEGDWTSADTGTDAFVVKLDDEGDIVWSELLTGPGYQEIARATVDAAGNLIIAGYGNGPLEIGDDEHGGPGDDLLFLAKLDSEGDVLWSRAWENPKVPACTGGDETPACMAIAVAVDPAGNVYLAGGTDAEIENVQVQGIDAFVIKLDPEGTIQWTKTFGALAGDSDQWITSVAADCAGVVVGGGFRVAIAFDGLTLQTVATLDEADAFVARLDDSGAGVWAKHFGDAGYQTLSSVAVDGSGEVVVGAWVIDADESTGISFGGATLATTGFDTAAGRYQEDFVMARFARDGSHRWSRRYGDEFVQKGRVAAGEGGAIVAAGDYYFGIQFDSSTKGTLDSSLDGRDLFVAMFAP
jgi:hypothetical protein